MDTTDVPEATVVEGATFQAYDYDGLGRVRSEQNDFAETAISRNSLGWAVRERLDCPVFEATFGAVPELSRTFDDAGAIVGLTYPSGRALRLDRNACGQLRRIENLVRGQDYCGDPATPDAYTVASFEYAGSHRTRLTLGNGSESRWQHDAVGRTIDISHRTSDGQALLTIQQLFDGAGNMRVRNDIRSDGNNGHGFKYDSLYRLTLNTQRNELPAFDPALYGPRSIADSDPLPNRQQDINEQLGALEQAAGEFTWEYDPAGNRTSERTSEDNVLDYATNAVDQYARVGETDFVYDANGNLVSDGARLYRYDSVDRLVRVLDAATGADIVRFVHDTRGRRIAEVAGNVTTGFVHNALDLVAEYREGLVVAQYVYDDAIDSPVQIAAASAEHYCHTDFVGSVRALTNSAGVAATTYTYTPFGMSEEVAGPYNPWRFTGRRLDATLGTYDFRTRQYDPRLGRFLQRDRATDVNGTNLYTYAANNPLSYVDPLGTERRHAGHRPRTSAVADLRAAIGSAFGDSPEGRAVGRIVGRVVGTAVGEPVALVFDIPRLGWEVARGGNVSEYQPTGDLALAAVEANTEGAESASAFNRNFSATLGLNLTSGGAFSLGQGVGQLVSPASSSEDRLDAAGDLLAAGLTAAVAIRTFSQLNTVVNVSAPNMAGRLAGLEAVADSGEVRWVAGDPHLAAAWQGAMDGRSATASSVPRVARAAFNNLRNRMSNRTSWAGPLHHFRNLNIFPAEALQGENLFATGSQHAAIHRAMGPAGNIYQRMAWGWQREVRDMFNFWNSRIPLSAVDELIVEWEGLIKK